MPTAKVFHKEDNYPCSVADLCVEGFHVHVTAFVGKPISQEVIVCDGTCKDKPVIQEIECGEDAVAAIRAKLGKKPVVLPEVP